MSELIERIETILKSEYSTDNYLELTTEIFDGMKTVNPNFFIQEKSNFSSYIDGYYHVGNYVTPDNDKIAVLTVQLQKASYVENARTAQRNFARKLIDAGNCAAAIIAFFTPGDSKWRLSFVRLDHSYSFDNGRFKLKDDLTPAKRYSYLVGKDEPCHTAISRFHSFIIDKKFNPTLDEIEDAFSVEKVTKDFYEEYCEKYLDLVEYLNSNEDFVAESQRCGFDAVQFAKKLMGQIVFLYFLQKKGWLGVNVWPRSLSEKAYNDAFFTTGAQGRIVKQYLPQLYLKQTDGSFKLDTNAFKAIPDEEEAVIAKCMHTEQAWGSGSRKFLRAIFNYSVSHGENFYDDALEYLFYDTLNRNRGEQAYCPKFHCRVPFLSGGLFEPIDGYDWKSTHFSIPDSIFSNVSEKGERHADGILDVFDRYNFTISEDEPMEREVAIDPEMLGKVFENLLDVKDRKSKGAFYTPREIVHYMCQESLINYLINKTGLSEEGIRDLILYGDFMKDEDTVKEKRLGNGGMYIASDIFALDKDGNVITSKLAEIDHALETVRVADPAVGSGAFPLGMLNEIVKARQTLTEYMIVERRKEAVSEKQALVFVAELRRRRTPYILKKTTIKNCIFAVDIEPSAVDIARLRLWLSLVIDDELNPNAQDERDGSKNPSPLPNLECNIICGNSLVDEFQDVELINKAGLIGTDNSGQINFGTKLFQENLDRLIRAQDELFYCKDTLLKDEIMSKIATIRKELIEGQLENCTEELKNDFYAAEKLPSKPYVLWQIDFARVFKENGGFDVVIGNPPYIDSETMVNSGLEQEREFISRKYSFCKGNWDIYIAFFEKGFSILNESGYQIYITPDKWISKSFGDALRIAQISFIKQILIAGRDVFESALVDSIVTSFDKSTTEDIVIKKKDGKNSPIEYVRTVNKRILEKPFALDILFSDYIDIIGHISCAPMHLGDRYSCENACATSDCYILKDILFSLDKADDYNEDEYYRVINTGTIGRFIDRWSFAPMKYLKDKYPNPVVRRSEFEATFPNSYGKKASKKKMIIKGLTLLDASLDLTGNTVPGKSTMIIPIDNEDELKYVAAFINSKISIFYIKQKYSSSSYNGGINFSKDMINTLPMPDIDNITKGKIISLVTDICGEKAADVYADTTEKEKKIDEIFYLLFGLSASETKIIEQSFSK